MEGRRHTLRACAGAIVGMLALQARSSLGQEEMPRSYIPNVQQGSMPVGGLPLTQPLPSSPGKIMTGEPVSVPLESQPGQVIASGPVTDLPAESATGLDHDHMHGAYVRDLVKQVWGYADPENAEVLSVHQLACLIDCLDKKLFGYGKIAVQAPTVFGQNRMTGYRQDYEDQMKGQLQSFELILSAYQRRADAAALTSATSIAAAVQTPGAASGGGGAARGASSSSSSTVAIPSPVLPFASLFNNASTLIGQNSADLTTSILTSLALANSASSKAGIGLEPTVALDERSDFINHLNQLRRINAGDDASDLPGYGLYLIRMPVSLLPSQESIKGKGASVTVKAKHNLTPDVLPNTFRNVVILDTAYSLMDMVNRGQFGIDESPCSPPAPSVGAGGAPPSSAPPKSGSQAHHPAMAAQSAPGNAGNTNTSGNAPRTEVLDIFGKNNIQALVDALQEDQKTWYRHDPSTVSWLLTELSSTYDYMREQAHRNNPMFQPIVFEQIGAMVLQRRYASLAKYRESWLTNLRASRGAGSDCVKPIDVLAFALIVQSVFLDRQIKYDMELLAQRKHCACGDAWDLTFYDLYPTTPEDVERYSRAQAAFSAYVECKWPIHIFALDPVVDQQNELDLFSQRTQLQLALAVAVASGQVNFQNAESYARRTELDLATVALNRTAVGFGAGETTFGWQFYPRVQTPPLQSNLSRIAGILISNGPGPDYDLKNRKIEPGLRECYALVVMPNFVPSVKFTSVTNWFDLKTKHADQVLETTDMIRLGKKLQAAKNGLQRVCDSGKYRPEEVELLSDRISQLEDFLPVKSHSITLPFEGSLLGSEIFSSNAAGLAPRLLAWYGEPPQEGADSSIFILGNGFSVHEIHAIAGGVTIDDTNGTNLEMISRNVLRLVIPANARAIQTTLPIPVPDGTTAKRKLLDVHVATPNGISNHLLVEIQPKPSTDQTAASVTRKIGVNYTLLQRADGAAFVPVAAGVSPADAEVDLAWDPTAGAPPAMASATFTFPNVLAPGGGDLVITASGLTGKGNTFALSGLPLNVFASTLIDQLGPLGVLTPATPPTQLTSNKISLIPPAPAKAQDATTTSGPVIVSLAPTLPVAQISPSAFQVTLAANAAGVVTASPGPNASDVTLDWLSDGGRVQSSLTIELTMDGAPVGSLTFSDSAGDITFQKKSAAAPGKRTIAKATFLAKLNALLATAANKPTPGKGRVLNARTISITPQLDGVPLAPVLVDSPFEIDTDPFPKAAAVTRQGATTVAGRGSAPIGSLRPGAAAHDPTVAASSSTLGRGVVMPPLRDSSIARAATGKNRPVSRSLTPPLPSGRAPEAAPPAVSARESSRTPATQGRPRLLQRLFRTGDSQ